MSSLVVLCEELQSAFPADRRGHRHARWFVLTLQAILVPFVASRTSGLLRALAVLFGERLGRCRYYAFMASPKLPWESVWRILRRAIPDPLVDGRLLLAIDDTLNAKTGRQIFACQTTFDHAPKPNRSRFPWAQTVVTVGLLKTIHGRWCCLPLAGEFYLRRATLAERCRRLRGQALVFRTKLAQAAAAAVRIAADFAGVPVLAVTDTWFGNRTLLEDLRRRLGARAHVLTRLRSNAALYDLPAPAPAPKRHGRPRKYGKRLGNAAALAKTLRSQARSHLLHVYGAQREILAADCVVMLKTLRCPVRVVFVYRKSQWVALATTDLDLSLAQIVEYYSARWKIESGFREIRQEIGSAQTQTRKPDAVWNHLQFCMAAVTIVWIYAARLEQAPARRYASRASREFTFADARRSLALALAAGDFGLHCPDSADAGRNSQVANFMELAA